jgi:hypothetical protein
MKGKAGVSGRRGPFSARTLGRLLSLLALLPALLMLAAPAHAAFPGENGKIAFDKEGGIYAVNADGTDLTTLVGTSGSFDPAWSSDGSKIAFARRTGVGVDTDVYVMNADGTGATGLTSDPAIETAPAWSPDGTRIAFQSYSDGDPEIYTMGADGSDPIKLTNNSSIDALPAWSPDGQRIAFNSNVGGNANIWIVSADGSGQAQSITTSPLSDVRPNWSPDAARIAFMRVIPDPDPSCDPCDNQSDIYTIDSDGSGETLIRPDADGAPAWSPDGSKLLVSDPFGSGLYTVNADGTGPPQTVTTAGANGEWQPVHSGYARPKGATKMVLRFVPAYEPCSTPNAVHGAPLAADSCSPAVPVSDFLTVGTPESNGAQANSTGYANLRAICNPPAPGPVPPCSDPGDQGDEEFQISITDVRQKLTLLDYAGELEARMTLRITDRWNGLCPGCPKPGTATDVPFSFAVPCANTQSASTGSTCSLTTTANAVAPGAAREGKRSVWRLGRFEIYDGGPDGDADTSSGNTLFAEQGLFVP